MPTYKLGSKTGGGAFSEVINPGLAAGDPEGVKKAKPRPGKVERAEKRETLKGINVELRGARKQSKQASKAVRKEGLTEKTGGALHAAQQKTGTALGKKADVKDWSTRKRVGKGGKKGVSLLKEPIEARTESGEALYKGGFDQGAQNISGIHGGGGATKIKDMGSENYRNVYTTKGEYKYSIPEPIGKGADLGDIEWPSRPPKTPGNGKETPDKIKEKRKFKGQEFKQQRGGPRAKHLKGGGRGHMSLLQKKQKVHKKTSGKGPRRRAKKR